MQATSMPATPQRLRAWQFFMVLLTACAAVAPQVAWAADVAPITLTPRKVSAHGWFFQGDAGMASAQNKGFMSNAGFVVTTDGVVVFDTLGTPALGEAMRVAIRKVTAQPIRRIVISHYHADHFYGLQAMPADGVTIYAHRNAEKYLQSGQPAERLEQRRRDLFPWVDDRTRIVPPTQWLDGDTSFRLGGLTFRMIYAEGAHSPEDLMLFVEEDRLLFAGDLLFAGRVPFVGNADSAGWLRAMDKMIALDPLVVIPGHGPASRDVQRDLVLTRDYLQFLRQKMGDAVSNLEPFDDAYAKTDWSRFKGLPAFEQANRINAWGTYLRMEQEALGTAKP
jgi:glyoxylase-like metal-dependent hydrolase (beta-lactamase superfamily II)